MSPNSQHGNIINTPIYNGSGITTNLVIRVDGGKESVAAMTLREGVTRVNETAIGFCAEAKQLLAAEAAAREAKRGLWGKLAAEEAAKVGLAGECEDSRGRRRWWGR